MVKLDIVERLENITLPEDHPEFVRDLLDDTIQEILQLRAVYFDLYDEPWPGAEPINEQSS